MAHAPHQHENARRNSHAPARAMPRAAAARASGASALKQRLGNQGAQALVESIARKKVDAGPVRAPAVTPAGSAHGLDRTRELWLDLTTAVALAADHMQPALARHIDAALLEALESVAYMLIGAGALLVLAPAAGAVFTGIGAALALEIAMVLLQWLGLGMLAAWVVMGLGGFIGYISVFFQTVWHARGSKMQLNIAAAQFADAIGLFLQAVLEAVVLCVASLGATQALKFLRASRFGRAFNNAKFGQWVNDRVRKVRAGETRIKTPEDELKRIVRGVALDKPNASKVPSGEFDGIDKAKQMFIENKKATGLDILVPKTNKPQQSATKWAAEAIFSKTDKRIANLRVATGTRATEYTRGPVPTLNEIQHFRHVHFVLDADTPALRAAVATQLAKLHATHPGWRFTAEFGINLLFPPLPSPEGLDDQHANGPP